MALDSDTCRRALNRAHRQLVNDIKPKEVLDRIESNGLLGYEQIKDIRGLLTSSMQNRILLSKISQKGVAGYELFKKCLDDSNQKDLGRLLVEIEKELASEKNRAETIQEERQRMLKQRELQQARRNAPGSRSASTREKLDKVPSDRELVSIAPSIGSGWELLAAMLDVKRPAVERIKLDHGYSSVEQIYNMLQHWKQRKANNATFRALLREMKECTAVTIDWEELREKIGFGVEVLDPEAQPMEIETQNQQVQMSDQRARVSRPSEWPGAGTLPMEPRSEEGENEPMDTTENPQAQNVTDGEEHFDTPAMQQHELHLGGTSVMPPPLDSPPKTISNNYTVVIQRDLFDGRLIDLEEAYIAHLKKNMKEITTTKGAQLFATTEKVPDFNTKLVIKELHIEKDDRDRMRSVTNEKLASRILHFGIVPLLAYHDALMTDQSVRFGFYYFVSPYFEKGDLLMAIKEDTNAIFTGKFGNVQMWHKTRIKIIYQVASAISYLHTPVQGFRHDVLHLDIKSPNIVLDCGFNARLIDFGLAREMREPNDTRLLTASPLFGTNGYFPTTKFEGLTKFHDYHNFGIVIRELLTGMSPIERIGEFTLRTMTPLMLKDKIQKNIWKTIAPSKDLLEQAERCVESVKQRVTTNTFHISELLEELKSIMRNADVEEKFTRNSEAKCEICVVNNAADESKYLDHESSCKCPIKVCVSCMRNSFLNPIQCHTCGEILQPFIGENWGAILIAGNDTKNKGAAEAFTKDVHRLADIIKSRSVPVMCIREENIEVVTPDDPNKEEKTMWVKVKEAFERLDTRKLKKLMVVYSGHHGYLSKKGNAENKNQSIDPLKSVTGSTIDHNEGFFQLSENELMKDVDLCNEIQKLTTVENVLLIEDCCHGDAEIKSELKLKKIMKFNSSTTTSTSSVNIKSKESEYIGALIKALTATEKNKDKIFQYPLCNSCNKIADTLFMESFLTLETLQKFISHYIEHRSKPGKSPTFSTHNLSAKDCLLAYRYHFPVVVEFKIKTPKVGKAKIESLSLDEFGSMQKLRECLFEKILENDDSTKYLLKKKDQLKAYAAAVSIQVEHGPREVHLKEIDSLEQASSAWITRREIKAQIRNVVKIGFEKFDVAHHVSPNDVEYIINKLKHVASIDSSSEESETFIVDKKDLAHCVTTLEKLREKEPEHLKRVFFDFNQSLDHIDTVLRNKQEDVADVKVHIVFPKNNAGGVGQFWPFIFYRLRSVQMERASLERANAVP